MLADPYLTLVPLLCSDELEHEILEQRSVAPDDVSADYRWGGVGRLERRFTATRSTTGAHVFDLSRCMQVAQPRAAGLPFVRQCNGQVSRSGCSRLQTQQSCSKSWCFVSSC